jgi:cytochrome c peroxidase
LKILYSKNKIWISLIFIYGVSEMRTVSKIYGLFVMIFLAFFLIQNCKKIQEESGDIGTFSSSLSPVEEIGKRLFFDPALSNPPGQACSFCHGPEVGFTGPLEDINGQGAAYEGAVKGRFGNRKPPAAAYAGESPVLHLINDDDFVGGMFWNGRASGELLGDPLTEQAMGPFLNPLEMNNADKKTVVLKVKKSDYADLFEKIWGAGSLDIEEDIDGTFERIARSIAAYQRSAEVNPFSSKFDEFWRNAQGRELDVAEIDEDNWQDFQDLGLDSGELEGFILFATKGKCAECHVLTSVKGNPPLFTDFTYDNLGTPKNPNLPFYAMAEEWNADGENWVDKGLGGYLEGTEKYAKYAAENYGKHKVPTLRNVDLRPREGFVKAFMHNGAFLTLKDVVHFYNTRDLAEEEWPPPEIEVNMNTEELGDLGLTSEEEDAIVLFMKTLSDRR